MGKKYVVTLDQGTTSSRAIVYDRGGKMLGAVSREHRQIYPNPGWVEHDPEEIYRNQRDVLIGVIDKCKISPREISAIGIKKGYKTHFWLKGSVSPRRFLFTLEAETIPLDVSRRLHIPELAMARDDRFAITGANGMGKSTLIRYILDHMNIPEERLVYLPQEIDLVQTRAIMSDLHGLSSEQLGKIMTVVSALGSRPERLLNNLDASPGELRKVLLALGVIRQPWLIVMDEPTNHLDLPAIECLEKALMDCPCGLLLISHDLRFLSGITGKRYHLQQKDSDITVSLEIF